MGRIKVGDIFQINTPKGKAYLHYINNDDITGELIRVLPGLYSELPLNLDELASCKERYVVSFPLNITYKRNIVEKVGFYPATNFSKPKFMRTEHNIRGEFLGWHIVDTDTYKREFVEILNSEQKKMSPWGIWNYNLLIDNLVKGWDLENW